MLAFNRTAMKNLIGLLAVAGLVIAETTGYLEKFFQMFEVPPTIEELGLELKMITAELEMLKDNGEKAFEGIKFEAYKLRDALKLSQLGLEETSEEFKELERMINAVEEAISNVPLQNLTFGLDEQTEKVGILTQAWRNFSEGFNEAITKQKTGMEQIKEIGKNTFKELKNVLTDFVMTGKLKFEDFARSIIRQFVEMLIGQAIQFALKKSMAMFKMDALKKAMISLYEGAMKTFASIPFPWNMLVVGGAIAAGKSIINKMKSHEQGGAVSKGRPVLVGERGPELFVPNTTGQITQNARGTDTGTTNINFSINATDVTGVRKLLIDNRATIVNVINSALNEKGREALV
jgi:lambda family phage tail tape measure protein